MSYRDKYTRLRSDIPRWALRGPDGEPLTGPSGYLLIEVEKMGLGCYELHHDGQVFRPDGLAAAGYGTLAEAMEAGIELAGDGPAIVTARRMLELATAEHEQAQQAEREALDRRRVAGQVLALAERRRDALAVLGEIRAQREDGDSPELAKLEQLATPGTRVWLLPKPRGQGYVGLGRLGISLGMTGPTGDHLVVISAEGNDAPYSWLRLKPLAVLTAAEARERWWITSLHGRTLVYGRSYATREQALADRDGYPIRQGAEFIPADDDGRAEADAEHELEGRVS